MKMRLDLAALWRLGVLWIILVALILIESIGDWPHGWKQWALVVVLGPPAMAAFELAWEGVAHLGRKTGLGRLALWVDEKTAAQEFSGIRVLFVVALIVASVAAIWGGSVLLGRVFGAG